MSGRFVVLLRGINVGGHNRVPMAELRQALADGGFSDVTTYIQSGNIVLNGPAGYSEKDVVTAVEGVMTHSFNLSVPVVARRAEEWPAVTTNNPLAHRVDQPKLLHVYFCDTAPSAQSLALLDDPRYAGEELAAVDRHLYVFYVNGAARSKLTTNELEKRLQVTATGRNWSTVTKLADLAG